MHTATFNKDFMDKLAKENPSRGLGDLRVPRGGSKDNGAMISRNQRQNHPSANKLVGNSHTSGSVKPTSNMGHSQHLNMQSHTIA